MSKKFFIAFVFSLAFAACKKSADSNVKTVDAAAHGVDDSQEKSTVARATEYCLDTPGSDAKAVVNAIMQKLPMRLAKEYGAAKVTLIQDADKLNQVCAEANKKDHTPAISSGLKYVACWAPTSKKLMVDARPEIILHDDVDTVHSNLIAMVVLSYTELYIDQIMSVAADKMPANDPAKAALNTFKASRKNLAEEFEKYLESLSGQKTINLYKEKFLGSVTATPAALISDVGFQNFVLSEVAESAYCSADTRKVLDGPAYQGIKEGFKPFEDFFATL